MIRRGYGMSDRYTLNEVRPMMGGEHNIREEHYGDVISVLSRLPKDVIDYIIDNIYITTCIGGTGEFIPYETLKRFKGVILLCHTLWEKGQGEIDFTIAHQVAHAYLNHKTSTPLSPLSKEEGLQQEAQADEKAVEWGVKKPNGWRK